MEYLYALGYNIVALTDHDYTALFPDTTHSGANLDPNRSTVAVPMTTGRVTEMQAGVGRGANTGMLFIPGTNEHSQIRDSSSVVTRTHHIGHS